MINNLIIGRSLSDIQQCKGWFKEITTREATVICDIYSGYIYMSFMEENYWGVWRRRYDDDNDYNDDGDDDDDDEMIVMMMKW